MAAPDIVGKRTVLLPMRQTDVDLLVGWVSAPEAQAFWLGHAAKRAEVLDRWPPVYFDDAYPQKGRCFRVDAAQVPVGAVIYHAVWGRPRNVRVELVLAPQTPPDLGADALEPLAQFLFESLRVTHLWAEVPPGDTRTLAAFTGAGFAREARTADEARVVLHRTRPGAERTGTRPADTKPK